MRIRLRGIEGIALTLLAALAVSCASTGGDVDVTPQLRTNVDAHIGKSFTTEGNKLENLSSDFGPNETVYAVVDVPGKVDGSMRIRWAYGNETLDEQTVTLQSGVNVYPFRLLPPTGGHRTGDYRFEVFVNENRAETETFTVR
jgi:hypothetical protein